MYIEELIHDAGMEGYNVEYKERLNHDDIIGWLKTIAGFANADELLNWLRLNMPASECTLTHGDFCLPNLFTDGKRFTGMIDLGDCGIADPWRDISLGWRSLKHNSDGHFGSVYSEIDPDDLFRAIGIPKDEEKLRYYLLLDELL